MPATNMWCPQTRKPKTAIASARERDEACSRRSFLREKSAISSLITPIAGRIMM